MEAFFIDKILPAVTLTQIAQAIPVTEALIAGGLKVMEIPFRTPVATEAIRTIRTAFPQLAIGAGTLLSAEQVEGAKRAGAQFGLAPGFNPEVVRAAKANDLPFIPGVMSPSEVEQALTMGCRLQKLFPAVPAGGIALLKALEGPYAHTGLQFIPMGGVSLHNMNDFLALPNVLAVGGSWLASKHLVAHGKYADIQRNVREALEQV